MSTYPIPDEALANHIAILGKTGSGKSNAAKTLAERALDRGERVCILDPTGTWYGLRLTRAGKPSPYKVVIFGGRHGDLPIGGAHGAAIAETVGTTSTPAVIDTRLMTVTDRTRFFTDFAEALLRTNRGPLTLIIDEAHLFAPQGRVNDPRSGAMVHAANNLVSLGRGLGLRIVMISQRPAKLHKDSLTQVETLVAMRLIAPHDREAVRDWIKETADLDQGREIISSMASLPTGDAWVWSPEIGVLHRGHFPLASTFDSGSIQANAESAPDLAALDLAEVTQRLEKVAADVLANDPRALKAEIARLRAEASKAPTIAADPAAIEDARQRGYHEGWLAGIDEGVARGRHQVLVEFEKVRTELPVLVDRALHDFGVTITAASGKPVQAPRPAAAKTERAEPTRAPAPRPEPRAVANGATVALSGPQSRLINAVAWWRNLGFDAPTRVQVAFVASYKPNTGTFNTYLGALSSAGLIAYPARGHVSLTEAGIAQVSDIDDRDLLVMVKEILSGPQVRLLEATIGAYPESISRDDLATAAGYSPGTGTFNTYLGSLSTLDLVSYPARGQVRAADWLFP